MRKNQASGAKFDIAARYDFRAETAVVAIDPETEIHPSLDAVSICIVVTSSGHVAVGKSVIQPPAVFVSDVAQRLAFEDAVRQLRFRQPIIVV